MKIKKNDVINKCKRCLNKINFKYKDDVVNRINIALDKSEHSIDDYSIISELICCEWKKEYPQFSNNDILEYAKNYEISYMSNELFEICTSYAWRKWFWELLEKKLNKKINLRKVPENEIGEYIVFSPPLIYKNKEVSETYSQGKIPIEWLCTFKLLKVNTKNTKMQGENNGPDYVFINNNNEMIGVEIAYLIKTRVTYNNRVIRDIDKFKEDIFNKISVKNTKEIFEKAKNTIEKHNNSALKYEKCDKYYLLLLTDGQFTNSICALLEYYCNDSNKINSDRFEHIYVI